MSPLHCVMTCQGIYHVFVNNNPDRATFLPNHCLENTSSFMLSTRVTSTPVICIVVNEPFQYTTFLITGVSFKRNFVAAYSLRSFHHPRPLRQSRCRIMQTATIMLPSISEISNLRKRPWPPDNWLIDWNSKPFDEMTEIVLQAFSQMTGLADWPKYRSLPK